jgi:hypothetical protein
VNLKNKGVSLSGIGRGKEFFLGEVGWLGKEDGGIQSHNKYYIVCLLFLFLASTNIVLDLNFHFVFMFLQA